MKHLLKDYLKSTFPMIPHVRQLIDRSVCRNFRKKNKAKVTLPTLLSKHLSLKQMVILSRVPLNFDGFWETGQPNGAEVSTVSYRVFLYPGPIIYSIFNMLSII